MKKIISTVSIIALLCNASVAQNKLKSLWNNTFSNSDSLNIEEEFIELEPTINSDASSDKKSKNKKQASQNVNTENINQENYTWAEDQMLYFYLLNEKKDYAKAVQVGKIMLEKTENAKDREIYQIGQSHSNLGMAYYFAGDYLAAHHHLTKASEISEKLYRGSSMALANDFVNLSRNYSAIGYHEQAKTFLKTAIDIKIAFLGGNSEQVYDLKHEYDSTTNNVSTPITKIEANPKASEPLKSALNNTIAKAEAKSVSRIDTLYIYKKDTIVMKQNAVAGANSKVGLDDKTKEALINEAITRMNKEAKPPKATGLTEDEKQQLITKITTNVKADLKSVQSSHPANISNDVKLDEATKEAIITDAIARMNKEAKPVKATSLTEDEKQQLITKITTDVKADLKSVQSSQPAIKNTDIKLDEATKEALITEAIARMNKEAKPIKPSGLTEEEKQQLITKITTDVKADLKSVQNSQPVNNSADLKLDEATKKEIIDALYTKIKADYPIIKGKTDTIMITHNLNPNEKDEIAKVVIAELSKTTSQTAEPVYTKSTNDSEIFVIVKKGDSLFNLSQRFNTTIDAIKKLNNLNSNEINIGQNLRLK